jgi:hypothetical protein
MDEQKGEGLILSPDGVSGSTRQDFVQRLAASQVYLRNTSATLEALQLWRADFCQAYGAS